MSNKPVILAFLQNMWVKDPERVRAAIARDGEEFRLYFIKWALFRGCKTGRILKKAFGDDVWDEIIMEETTREIAGDPKTIFPADVEHIEQCLKLHNPGIVLAFGGIAHAAVSVLIKPPVKYIHAHHPASRHPDSYKTLTAAAQKLKEFLI